MRGALKPRGKTKARNIDIVLVGAIFGFARNTIQLQKSIYLSPRRTAFRIPALLALRTSFLTPAVSSSQDQHQHYSNNEHLLHVFTPWFFSSPLMMESPLRLSLAKSYLLFCLNEEERAK
jgi:hypothetical protein